MVASNWWVPTQPGPAWPGGAEVGGGGSIHNAGVVQYRSPLDAQRAARGSMPHAEYPDGYLGTITDRREDRLLDAVQERLTERSYQRGVHKGEKIQRSDYFWDQSCVDPMGRLKAEARAKPMSTGGGARVMLVERYAPTGNPVERLAHLGKTAGLSAPEQADMYKRYGVSIAKNPVVINDPGRNERMQKMLPRYVM
jgi:hypothetical protein